MINNEEKEYLENRGLIGIAFKQMHLYFRTQDDYQDYTDAGTDGLLRGIRTFDENKGVKKSTYYYTCIRNEIHTKIVEKNRLKNQRHVSLNQIANDLDGTELIEVIPSEENIEEEIIEKGYVEYIAKQVESIKIKKDREVIKYYYGLNGYPRKNCVEIAKLLGVSSQSINVRKIRALNELRKKLEKEKYEN